MYSVCSRLRLSSTESKICSFGEVKIPFSNSCFGLDMHFLTNRWIHINCICKNFLRFSTCINVRMIEEVYAKIHGVMYDS